MDLTNKDDVAALQSNMHAVFDSPAGKEVMHWMEMSCCWYKSVYDPASPELTLINDGKRQVVATIKTMLECSPDMIVALVTKSEQ